jgi:arabinogalactan oligomer / maltooligosaccharide transport system permease protein
MKTRLYPYLYILPATLFVALIVLFPTIYSLYLAFTNYSLYHFEHFDYVGLKNFKTILFSAELSIFFSVFVWTCIWAIGSVVLQFGVGLVFALILNKQNLVGRNIYRTFLIVPWAVPSFITVLMWTGLLNTNYGAINSALVDLPGLIYLVKAFMAVSNFVIFLLNAVLGLFTGHHAEPLISYLQLNAKNQIPWLTDAMWARCGVLLVNLWLGFPYMMSISLGALQSVPGELFEASSLDGASKVQQFRKITMPLLRSSILPVLITSFAFNFNNFVGIYLLTAGGPAMAGSRAGATDILVSYTYKLAFTLSQFGLACAYAVLIFLLIGSLSAINFKLTGAFKD